MDKELILLFIQVVVVISMVINFLAGSLIGVVLCGFVLIDVGLSRLALKLEV